MPLNGSSRGAASLIRELMADIAETELDALAVYLTASPWAVDMGSGHQPPIPENLPANLQRLLKAEETAQRLWDVAVNEHRLGRKPIEEIARVLRDIILGEASAARLQALLQERVGLASEQTLRLTSRLSREFITPNYFQIAQVYEKKHGKGVGSRGSGVGTKPPTPPATPPLPTTTTPPRVVDLRNGAIPSRLPPPPPVAPLGAEWGPPPVAPLGAEWGPPPLAPGGAPAGKPPPSPPLAPPPRGGGTPAPPPPPGGGESGEVTHRPPPLAPKPPSSRPPGPTADDLIKKLNSRLKPPVPFDPAQGKPPTPPPPPVPRPPGGGTHGPLPPPPAR